MKMTTPAPPAKKTTKPAKPAEHPPYSEMIKAAIVALKDRTGSSRQAIAKYIIANYKVSEDSVKTHLKNALRRGVEGGKFLQPKGKGASGSFKVAPAAKVEKPKKKAAPKKPAAKAKKPAAKKPAAKKPAAKKAKKPAAKKAAKSPKKPAAKKAAKSPKKPAAKKAAKKPVAKKPAAKKPAAKKPAKKTGAKKAAKKWEGCTRLKQTALLRATKYSKAVDHWTSWYTFICLYLLICVKSRRRNTGFLNLLSKIYFCLLKLIQQMEKKKGEGVRIIKYKMKQGNDKNSK